MSKTRVLCLLAFLTALRPLAADALPTLWGTYEVSYIYNTMIRDIDGFPQTPVEYSVGLFSSPLEIALVAGQYQIKIISGRQTGNEADKDVFDAAVSGDPANRDLDYFWDELVLVNNPDAIKYQTGFDGGNTNPLNDPEQWWHGTGYWVGDPQVSGSGDRIWGVGTTRDFNAIQGDRLWLFWTDSYSKDNLGGVTIELWQLSMAAPIPEPGTAVLLGAGLLGFLRRGRRGRRA